MLVGLAQTHSNPRLDPTSPQFDKAAFGNPTSWKIVAVRPRIDKAWTELRVVYQAVKAPEPVFAMFRLRPVVEYVPALPRPDEEREANNKIFLGMVAKHLMKDGGAEPEVRRRTRPRDGKAVSALMTDVMTFDDTKTKPYLHGFAIGIALEARMGGGSARNADGSYKSGDGWGWSAHEAVPDAPTARRRRSRTSRSPASGPQTAPSKDSKTWVPACAPRFNRRRRARAGLRDAVPQDDGLRRSARRRRTARSSTASVDANNLFFEHKKKWTVERLALEDGRRDLGEENGMTCSQCHIRNFGMHDYGDPANVDPIEGRAEGAEPRDRDAELPDRSDDALGGRSRSSSSSTRSAAARCCSSSTSARTRRRA